MAKARIALLIAVLVGLGGISTAYAALEPHRAAYRLMLANGGRSQLLEVRGGLVIEWRLACDGWLSRQRLGFVAATEDGQGFSHDVRFSSWEALDGSTLRYSVRSFDGDDVREEYRGQATIDLAVGGGTASFKAPHEEEVELPPGTVFPTDHIRRVLETAGEGEHFVSHEVFDGWGFDALTHVTSVIGEARTVEPSDQQAIQDDQKRQAWPVSMAYYNVEEQTDLPEFEATFLLTENGVLRELLLDYGEFKLDATLETLELLGRPDC